MAKWVLDPVQKKPVRVGDEAAAHLVDQGGRYLGKYEAARMLAAVEAKEGHNAKVHSSGGTDRRGAG